MQGESVYQREVFTSARRCLREFKGDVKQNSRLYKKKKWRGAPLRSKTRSLEDRRGALSQIEEPDFFYSKEPGSFLEEPFPFSKVGRDSEITRQSAFPVCRHSSHAPAALRKLRAALSESV